MGTPTIGGDLAASINEGDFSVGGDLDDIGFGTGNTDDTFIVSAQGTYGTATINLNTGQWTYVLDNSDPDVIALGPGDTLSDTFTVTMTDTAGAGNGQSDTAAVTITINGVICFLAGTLIDTPDGPRAIETLAPGDMVLTLDGPPQPVRWIGQRDVTRAERDADPRLHPVRITAGSLGDGQPARDLLVSRQHRMLVRSPVVQQMFGAPEALVPAIKLTGFPGIHVDETVRKVEYFHLLFDRHEVIMAECALAESLFTGPEALKTLTPATRAALMAMHPDLGAPGHDPAPARILPNGPDLRSLIARLIDGGTPLCIPAPGPAPQSQASRPR